MAIKLNKLNISVFEKYTGPLYIVVLPVLILSVYYLFFAADRYVSQAIFTIQENSNTASSLDIALLGFGDPGGYEDQRIMEEYLLTEDMLAYLDDKIDLKKHYQHEDADWFSVMSGDATREDFLEYYHDHIDVYFDDTSNLLYLEVQAFTPEYSKLLSTTILDQAEKFVNDINHSLAIEQHTFVEKQLKEAQLILKEARQKLLLYQNKYGVLSPEQEGVSMTGILGVLESELSQEKANLKMLLGSQNKKSPQVILSKERVRALSEQIIDEKRRLTGEEGQTLNDIILQSTDLQLEFEFAKQAYASMLAAYEVSRSEVAKKMKHLVVVSKPSLPEDAEYPDKLYIIATAFLILGLIYIIVRMSISTIKEHRD